VADTTVADTKFITKVLVPRRREDVLRRQRLIDLLHEHLHLRLQTISAPAGYGKTTLLVDFASDLEIPVCWHSLDTSDQDPRLLFEGILATIRFRFPGFGQQTQSRLLMTEDVVTELNHLIGTLTGEIYAAIPDYFVLVFEDYHFVQDSDAARQVLNLFVNRAPDNCHIIISSRIDIEMPSVAALTFQRRAASLGTAHLSFTTTEVKELLAAQYGLNLSDEQAAKLSAETEGWIAGILLSAYGKCAGSPSGSAPTPTRQDIFQYLASEVYERQPPEIKRFLLASSTLNQMEPTMCDRLLGAANSQKLLRSIEKRNLFTSRVDGEKTWYRYHRIFNEFLQAKLLKEDPKRFMLLHCRAASLFKQDQQWNETITHFLTARKYDECLRVIKDVGDDFLKSGKWVSVSKWIEALPRDMRLSDPALVLFHAQSLIHVGQVYEAAQLLTGLLQQLTGEEDWLYAAKALSWRGAAFRLTGRLADAKRDIQAAIHLLEPHHGPAEVLGDAYRRLGDIHAEQGHLRLALRHQRRALEHYSSLVDVGVISIAQNSLGIIYRRLGDFTKANVHFEYAREGWQKVKNYGALAMTLNNIGIIYRCKGQYDLALETLRLGLERARESAYRRTEACLIINIGDVLRDLELYQDSLTAYQEGLELAREVMEPSYVTYATAGIAETYRLLGAPDKAEVMLKEAISQAEEQGQTYAVPLFATQLGIIEYERGQHEMATIILRDVCERLKVIGDKEALAKAYFHLAQVSFLSKKYEAALDLLEKVSRLVDELRYEDFLAVEGKNLVPLIQYAASKHIGYNRFARIMEKIRRHRDGKGRVLAPGVLAVPSLPAKPDVEAHAFGESLVLLNGRQVSEAEWRSNRAKEIFFFVLRYSTGQTKEQIITALWPDLSPAKGTSNFHINLYRARRALYPRTFVLEQGRYKLNLDINIWFDVAEFESLLKQTQDLPLDSATRETNLERAIQLYRGAFMEEFYTEWVEMYRRELEDTYLKALSLLAGFQIQNGRYSKAISLLEKFIAVDPYQEEVYCQMIECHLAAVDTVSALRVYNRCLDAITGETDFVPSTRLQDLRRHISIGRETI